MTRIVASWAQRNAPGEQVCGDAVVMLPGDGIWTAAVIDGLGHGPQAAAAASLLCDTIRAHAAAPLRDILDAGHQSLHGSRGAAATLLRIDERAESITVLGVGNVELRALSREPIRPVPSPGVVGARMRKVVSFDYALHPGDVILVYTDGISSRFDPSAFGGLAVEEMAQAILQREGKAHDDATCLAVRYG